MRFAACLLFQTASWYRKILPIPAIILQVSRVLHFEDGLLWPDDGLKLTEAPFLTGFQNGYFHIFSFWPCFLRFSPILRQELLWLCQKTMVTPPLILGNRLALNAMPVSSQFGHFSTQLFWLPILATVGTACGRPECLLLTTDFMWPKYFQQRETVFIWTQPMPKKIPWPTTASSHPFAHQGIACRQVALPTTFISVNDLGSDRRRLRCS